jgi:hypothetical protein
MIQVTFSSEMSPMIARVTLPSVATLRALPVEERERRIEDALLATRDEIVRVIEVEVGADLRLIPA